MKKIDEPDFKVSDVCDTVITDASNKEDKHIKDVFTQVDPAGWKAQLEHYEINYLNNRNQLYTMEEMDDAYGVTIEQMKGIFTYCMTGSRTYKDRLYSLAPDRCPICDKRWGFNDKNLDHVLPKSKFPQFAITPHNLVTTCDTCNKRKHDGHGKDESTGVFNAYFHQVSLAKYIKCYIYASRGDIVVNVHLISFDESEIQDENQYQRLKYWFEKLYDLDQMYNINVRNNILKLVDEFARSEIPEGLISEEFLRKEFQTNYDEYNKFDFSDGLISDEFLIFIMYDSLANKSPNELIALIKENILARKSEIALAKCEDIF